MGQCCRKPQSENPSRIKQNKNIDDKRMFKIGVEVLRKDFCVQIGYNRRAVKNYSKSAGDSGAIGYGEAGEYSGEIGPIKKTENIETNETNKTQQNS